MSGLYIVNRNGTEYFLPNDVDNVETPTSNEDEATLNGITIIGNQLSEFLNCFQLFGYDSHGRPVKLTRVSSYMESTAIEGLIRDYLEDQEMEKWSSMDIVIDDEEDDDDDSESH